MSSYISPGFRLDPCLIPLMFGRRPSQSNPSSLNLKLHSRPVKGTFLKLGEKTLKNLCVPKMRYRLSLIVSNLSLASPLLIPRPLYLRNSMLVLPNTAWNQFHNAKSPIVQKPMMSSTFKNSINFGCSLNV